MRDGLVTWCHDLHSKVFRAVLICFALGFQQPLFRVWCFLFPAVGFFPCLVCFFSLFALSDGTAPDFGASNRGFVASLTGVTVNEPSEVDMNMWKGIFSSIHRSNFCFQIAHFYGLITEIKRWPAADDVLVNIAPFPAGAPAPVNGTSRLMFTLLLAEPEGALPPALRARLVAHCVNPRVPSMKALSAHEDVFGEFKKYAVMAQGIGLNPELSAKIIVWHEDSKTKSEDRFGPGDQVILTNEEATQALPSLGQIVVNLSISSAFPACKALAGKTGAHTTRPYHTCLGLTPDTNWIERFSLVLEPVDRDAAEALRLALRNLPVPAGKAPPVTPAKSAALMSTIVTNTHNALVAKAKAAGEAYPKPNFAALR